ncbi:regulator of G-protein signaling 22 [Cheilinus undulatus]|uniref:regulator of G-protein signaling 22 n=1 Tax=Cheilinus undulatus TaxID=241271 RepID=UPI001BD54290|nr:regulator of G-protein signaling 22 [Cheilinus undulatus]
MCGVTFTELTNLTAENFENCLATDDVLIHYFNDFLSLPSFPRAFLYNRETGLFEVVTGAAEVVSSSIRSDLHRSKSQLLTGDPRALARYPPVDNHYTVCCLDKDQGIRWIVSERLPSFLKSDCYNEYRLVKLLLQCDPNLCTERSVTSNKSFESTPQQHSRAQISLEDKPLKGSHSPENRGFTRMHSVAHLPSEQELYTKCSQSSGCFSSCSESEDLHAVSSSSSFYNLAFKKTRNCISQTDLTALSDSKSENQHPTGCPSDSCDSFEQQMEHRAAELVQEVLSNALSLINGQSQANSSECLCKSEEETNCSSTERSCESKAVRHRLSEGRKRFVGKKESGEEEKTERPKKNCEVGSWGTDQEKVLDICCHGPCCYSSRPCFDEFKEFLQGTPGEKLLNFWMDIERLKATQNRERKKRYVFLMRSCYLLSSSHSSLNVELLSRLGLSTSPCWTEEKLHLIQPHLLEPLRSYWVPRFWTSQRVQRVHDDSPHIGLWADMCGAPPSSIPPQFDGVTQPNLSPDAPLPQSSLTLHTQLYSSRSQFLSSRRMEEMLQALYVEPLAGLYFTNFCEQSGNQLWENAVNFWTDLQNYCELFYQAGLDPYRVQRESQLLYSAYICSSARRSVGVNEEIRKDVYNHMIPANEELFDKAEEHALNILLEPWSLMVSRDEESFQRVHLQEEVRFVDSQEYRELQKLYEESKRRLNEAEQCRSELFSPVTPSSSLSNGPLAADSWSRVSPNYQGYRLGSLLRHRHEIGHFMSFLQNQNASIHLTCWLDLEQYRRTRQSDTAVRQERSFHIATKYLNGMYFFGPDSPATTEQQNDILRSAGGLERLKLECLSNPVVVKIQDVVRSHIEKTWLPLFLSTAEFTARREQQPEPLAAERFTLNPYRRRRRRREAWKAEGLWMSSSKEGLLFRRILLNPVTCVQFQHFVSLKGDFLENDLLFWLEVQRYKDLCHSHSDEATIQQKISIIIDCFINSSMPPALQIDIPPEQAQNILEKRHELGPYIFREAQMTVFSELLKFWPEFKELSSSIPQEQLLPLLQEKGVAHRARVRRLKRKEEEEEEMERTRAQEELQRPESSLPEENETDDDDDVTVEQEQSREKTPTHWFSWSYTKYMAALKREEVLLKKQNELEASSSTASDSSSHCSIMSAGRRTSRKPPSRCSAGTESKQSKGTVRACNMK